MDYRLLADELEKAPYAGLDDAATVAKLNEQSVTYFIEPETADLTNFLMNSGLYMKLLAVYRDHSVPQVRVAAEAALDLAQSQIKNVNLQNPAIQQLMGALVQGQVWTQAEAAQVVNFGKRTHSRAQELLSAEVNETDIARARLQDKLDALGELQRRAAAGSNRVTGQLGELFEQLATGQDITVPQWSEITTAFSEVEV